MVEIVVEHPGELVRLVVRRLLEERPCKRTEDNTAIERKHGETCPRKYYEFRCVKNAECEPDAVGVCELKSDE